MTIPKLNPIHFKPTWFFVRMPDDADDIQRAFGAEALALSDYEMIVLKLAIKAMAKNIEQCNDEREIIIRDAAIAVHDKISDVMDVELFDEFTKQ